MINLTQTGAYTGPSCNSRLREHLFLELQNYFTSLYSINEESVLKPHENDLLTYLWLYGELYVTYINNQVQLWRIIKKHSYGLELKQVHVMLIQRHIPTNNEYAKVVQFKPGINGVYIKWDQVPMNARFKYDDYINDQITAKQIWDNAKVLSQKKIHYKRFNNSEDIITEEINSILDPNTPYILEIDPMATQKADIKNALSVVDLDSGGQQAAFQSLLDTRNFWKDVLGMVVPTDNKKERKNLSETTSENYSSENTENITLRNLNTFAKQWNALTSDNLVFSETNTIITNQNEEDITNDPA